MNEKEYVYHEIGTFNAFTKTGMKMLNLIIEMMKDLEDEKDEK